MPIAPQLAKFVAGLLWHVTGSITYAVYSQEIKAWTRNYHKYKFSMSLFKI